MIKKMAKHLVSLTETANALPAVFLKETLIK